MAYDRMLVQVRERTFLEVLDLALLVVRHRPWTLGLAALAGIAPFAALNAWITSDPEFPLPAFVLLVLMETPWATAPLTAVLGGLMFGQRPTVGGLLGRLLRSFPALFVFQFLLRAILVVTFFLYPLIPSRLIFLNEVIVLEQGSWWKALGRSFQLCARRGGDLFAQWLGQVFFGAVFVACFWLGTGAALRALTTSELTWDRPAWGDVYGVRAQLALWLAIVFFAVARFLTYIDHRTRKEGWEIKNRLGDVGRTLEEDQAW
jgi:hypothetical protein